MPTTLSPIQSPSVGLLGAEPLRAAIEYAAMRMMHTDHLPRGDGHAVVLFPGLGAGRRAIAPLRRHCEMLGYLALDWGRGVNRGPDGDDVDAFMHDLSDHVERLIHRHEGPVSLLGWSLGGIYAREVAKRIPGRVRQVITIGSPFAGTPDATNAGWLYRLLQRRAPTIAPDVVHAIRVAPPVPTTSIYSRTDGVVAWQACRAADGPRVENVEVHSSHLGLVWHPRVLSIVAERLSQRVGQWKPHRGSVRRAAPTIRRQPLPGRRAVPALR